MKGKVGIALGICLLVSSASISANDALSLAERVLVDSAKQLVPMPDDVNMVTGLVAGGCGALGFTLYTKANDIAGLANGQVGQWTETVLAQNMHATDFYRGAGLASAVLGGYALFKKGPQYRNQFMGALAANYLRHQIDTWGTKQPDEFRNAVVEAVFAVEAFRNAKAVWNSL